MDEDGFFTNPNLSKARIAILGLGLMGGSMAQALRGRCAAVLAVDPDPATRKMAVELQIAERVAAHPAELLPEANVVILAAPVRAILAMLEDLPQWHPGRAFVLDLGSSKAQICAAMEKLPPRLDALGGHPMCGKEKNGLANADPALFQGAAFALCASDRTSNPARSFALNLVRELGAHPLWLNPETHDAQAAATSHLPYLAACALAMATPLEAKNLVGPGFRSTTRVAASRSEVMLDILESNPVEVLSALNRLQAQLARLETDLSQGRWESLRRYLSQAADQREKLVE